MENFSKSGPFEFEGYKGRYYYNIDELHFTLDRKGDFPKLGDQLDFRRLISHKWVRLDEDKRDYFSYCSIGKWFFNEKVSAYDASFKVQATSDNNPFELYKSGAVRFYSDALDDFYLTPKKIKLFNMQQVDEDLFACHIGENYELHLGKIETTMRISYCNVPSQNNYNKEVPRAYIEFSKINSFDEMVYLRGLLNYVFSFLLRRKMNDFTQASYIVLSHEYVYGTTFCEIDFRDEGTYNKNYSNSLMFDDISHVFGNLIEAIDKKEVDIDYIVRSQELSNSKFDILNAVAAIEYSYKLLKKKIDKGHFKGHSNLGKIKVIKKTLIKEHGDTYKEDFAELVSTISKVTTRTKLEFMFNRYLNVSFKDGVQFSYYLRLRGNKKQPEDIVQRVLKNRNDVAHGSETNFTSIDYADVLTLRRVHTACMLEIIGVPMTEIEILMLSLYERYSRRLGF